MNKAELIAEIETGCARFNRLLEGLSEAQMCAPGAIGKWSVKDLLAHIAVHEQRMLDWMQVRLGGAIPAEPQPYDLPAPQIDRLNEQIYQEYAHKTLAEIRALFEGEHARVLGWLAGADEASLFDPARAHLQGGEALWEAVAANTCSHYAEHGEDLRPWLG